jgi:hypothetical protein
MGGVLREYLFQLFVTFVNWLLRDLKVGWPRKREAEKLTERCFQLLAFGAIQFFYLSKANEKMIKSCK